MAVHEAALDALGAALPDAIKWCQPLEQTVTSDATTSAFAARRVDESEGRR